MLWSRIHGCAGYNSGGREVMMKIMVVVVMVMMVVVVVVEGSRVEVVLVPGCS